MRNNDFTSVKFFKVYIHSPCMLIDPMVYVSLLQKECIGFYVVTTCSNYSGLLIKFPLFLKEARLCHYY